ncbi:MAG TPA: NUDIX domain-containing protein [Usitatibacter sp.]|jgi:predicted NUDIX family NTP pyrophosphohydrolase|nr:NUDIX domain-containing protein [Usitatibacter sp.]
MPKARRSAGILMYRRGAAGLEVLLVHPGGPFWKNRDLGAWTIPKGEHDDSEEALDAARREFAEETGFTASGDFVPLAPVRQKAGKLVRAWALEGDCDADAVRSNAFSMEWPPRSGRMAEFPEVDRAAWFPTEEARRRILPAQVPLIDELESRLS